MNEHIEQFIETRVENQEQELQKDLGERMMKSATVAMVGVLATAIASAIWDAVKERHETQNDETQTVQEPTE